MPNEHRKLLIIYAIVKMYKKPVQFRYIITAKKCVPKQVAEILTKLLKFVQKSHTNYCERVHTYARVNRMSITASTTDVLQDIDKINKKEIKNFKNLLQKHLSNCFEVA